MAAAAKENNYKAVKYLLQSEAKKILRIIIRRYCRKFIIRL
ncbi:hypothetical protein [Orientia tsutsugamushi]